MNAHHFSHWLSISCSCIIRNIVFRNKLYYVVSPCMRAWLLYFSMYLPEKTNENCEFLVRYEHCFLFLCAPVKAKTKKASNCALLTPKWIRPHFFFAFSFYFFLNFQGFFLLCHLETIIIKFYSWNSKFHKENCCCCCYVCVSCFFIPFYVLFTPLRCDPETPQHIALDKMQINSETLAFLPSYSHSFIHLILQFVWKTHPYNNERTESNAVRVQRYYHQNKNSIDILPLNCLTTKPCQAYILRFPIRWKIDLPPPIANYSSANANQSPSIII